MQAEEQNYGTIDGGAIGEPGAKAATMSAQEERSWSILAHLSILGKVATESPPHHLIVRAGFGQRLRETISGSVIVAPVEEAGERRYEIPY